MGKTIKYTLPETYYLDYFYFVISYVETHYLKILQPKEINFIKIFKNLSLESRCLLVRMYNRKGKYFRSSKLFYREIKNINLCIDELHRTGFTSYNDSENLWDLVNLYTKPEIIRVSSDNKWPYMIGKGAKKADIIFSILENVKKEDIFFSFISFDPVISLQKEQELNFLKLLFFGAHHGDMSQFVVKAIGNAKFENYNPKKFTPQFRSRKEADSLMQLSVHYDEYKVIMELWPVTDLYDWFISLNLKANTGFPKSDRLLGKFALKLGYQLEMKEELEKALEIYQYTMMHPSRERQIRIYRKLSREEEGYALAQQILADSKNVSELSFAKDYLSSGSKRISRSTSKRLKEGKEISIQKNTYVKTELLVTNYFEKRGYEAFHTENYLWRSLFGLVFWEDLFNQDARAIHNPLQRAPSDIYHENFYEKRRGQLEKKLKSLTSKKIALDYIRKIHNQKFGVVNHFVFWTNEVLYLIENTLKHLPYNGIKAVLHEMARNIKFNGVGFPDLFVFNQKEYAFYEVKSPNDHLSAQQHFWIDFFNNQRIKTDILKIKWTKK